jgi:hypothetical protein
VLLANLVDQFQFLPPDWNMVWEEVGGGNNTTTTTNGSIFTQPCERPVLYKSKHVCGADQQ